MLILAGCVDGAGTETDEPTVDADDDLEDIDSNGAEDDTAAGENETDPEEADESEADEPDSGDGSDGDGELEIHHIDVGQADATLLIDRRPTAHAGHQCQYGDAKQPQK